MSNLLINREEFQRWADHPGTKAFMTYLADGQRALMKAWAAGKSLVPEQQAQAVLLGQLVRVSSDDIARQYGVEAPDAE